MCGIVGALLSSGSVTRGLIDGLSVLEYRGYDSAGIAVIQGGEVSVHKRRGRLANLEEAIRGAGLDHPGLEGSGSLAGIGHTRWATHGEPSDANAHPHTGRSGRLAMVHNGIIENYIELKRELLESGEAFNSETDTEVLTRYIDRLWVEEGGDEAALLRAVRRVVPMVRGYYALAILANTQEGPVLLAVRQGPPLVVGVTADGGFLSSDQLGVLPSTRDVVFLEDGDLALVGPGRLEVTDANGVEVHREARTLDWDPADTGKGAYPHYMLKEIHEQPDVIARTAFDRIDLGAGDVRFEGGEFDDAFCSFDRAHPDPRVRHGAPRRADRALPDRGARGRSRRLRFRVGVPVPQPADRPRGPLALAITQSGETADTLAATRLARELGARTAAICNIAGSTQVRESDGDDPDLRGHRRSA